MKKYLLLAIAILLTPMSVFSQNLSAYGVSLGDSKYTVERVLVNKDKKVKYDTSSKGEECITISYPSIASVTFDMASFTFDKNDKLHRICFSSADYGAYGMPGAPWEAIFRSKTEECKNIFLVMSQNLILKYGNPTVSSNQSAIWQMGNKRIELEYTYYYNYNQYNTIDSGVRVGLTYSVLDVTNSDF